MKIKKLHERFVEVEYCRLILPDYLEISFFDNIDLFMDKFNMGKNECGGGRWYFFRMVHKVCAN